MGNVKNKLNLTESLGHKATAGAIWASVDKFGTMILQFGVNLVLARLLIPSDFGAIGMLTIFIAVSTVLIDGGFGSALIQKKEPSQKDYSTIFWWNLLFSSFLYLILFFLSPFIARFFSMPILSEVLRIIGISLIINAIFSIQIVRLKKSLDFKTIAKVNICSYILSSIIAIILAYYGFGVWSLVAMQTIYGMVALIVLAFLTKWIPSFQFSKQSMKELFAFGGFIMAADIIQEICKNLQGIIIGKRFSATEMGYYSQANKLDRITSYSIPQVIVQVMYPVYSSIQDDKERLREVVCMNLRVISYLVFPIMALLILIAEPVIINLYGAKWYASIPYFQVLCVGGFFVCLQNINYYAVAAVGKSDKLFYWSFYKSGFLLSALLTGMIFGMYGILWGMVLSNINIFLVNAYLASKYAEIPISSQIRSITPIALTTFLTLTFSSLIALWLGNWILTSIVFGLTYIITSVILKLRALSESQKIINKLIRHE